MNKNSQQSQVYVDISRLLTAAWRRTPSGIERVEFAYAQNLAASRGAVFVAVNIFGRIRRVRQSRALALLAALERGWAVGTKADAAKARWLSVMCYLALCFTGRQLAQGPAVYVLASHHNLESPRRLARFKAATGAKLCAFVHDLIPLTHPEYARPGQAEIHRRRMRGVASQADAVIVNSAATGKTLRQFFENGSGGPPIHVAPLGVAPVPPAGTAAGAAPYFICLATIEPRKNHLLLLQLWRELAGTGAVPKLLLVGRRGWENEMVLDMLERCPGLAGCVEERAGVADGDLATLLAGARALLLPSFAEGFGLPVAEALAAGTPVLCSDLPALRETGGDVPEFLDPLDGPAWRAAILDFATPDSPRRAAQLARLVGWRPPTWAAHFAIVTSVIDGLAGSPRG